MASSYILGISAFYHDSAACLLRDGEVVAAAQEERFTRRKHDAHYPEHAVAYCLREAGIGYGDVTQVAFYEKPWLKFERLLETYLTFAPHGLPSFMKAMPQWLKEKLWIGRMIAEKTGFNGDLLYPEHHQSHAASAFFPSPFKRAAVLTMDGVGEWATTSWGVGEGNRIDLQHELRFPHSLGLLYSAFTYYTGFKVNSGEYKVMGLAPYGEPAYAGLILSELIDLKEDGSFRMNMAYFNYCQGLTMTSEKFHRLFGGPPRTPEAPLTKRDMDLARSVQVVAEEAMLRMARHVRKETGERNLCLAGGVALNCVGNGKMLREGIFDRVWVQPAAGDAGGALGAALFAWHQVLDQPRRADGVHDRQRGSLLGPSYTTAEIEAWLQSRGIQYERAGEDEVLHRTATAIAAGQVVGWFSGRMEFGPRALGSRSILADARRIDSQQKVNLRIKYRESFRPFAPAALAEEAPAYFDLEDESPYMLITASVRAEHRRVPTEEEKGCDGLDKLKVVRSDIPAVTHVDYSARIQTVDAERNPRFHRLLKTFRDITGCGVVINTSFNVRGEPMVCTPEDAYRCFMCTEMDMLVLEGCILHKEEQRVADEHEHAYPAYELD